MPNVQTGQSAAGTAGARPGSANPDSNSTVSPAFQPWLARSREGVEAAISAHLGSLDAAIGPHSRLSAAVQYSVNVGGKRLRPILVLEVCRVCGGRTETAVPAALAMELVHTFSLIHDDLPAMDDDDLRRGQPTNHKVYGDALAILAGDWLVVNAFSLLAANDRCGAVLPVLVQALAGGTQHMIEGQAADVEGEGRAAAAELVEYIHQRKTAALIETCCRLGATCAGASAEVVGALAGYGRHLGLAFQISDDLLDATGSAEALGKRVGKDAIVAKQTYPAAFGLAESEARARQEVDAALRSLDLFGGQADRLRDLACYVIQRDR